jgi:hypothetical protein
MDMVAFEHEFFAHLFDLPLECCNSGVTHGGSDMIVGMPNPD